MGQRIGFVSTLLTGTDGVTLEASKWAEVLEDKGHSCYWFTGELDRKTDRCFLVPEAHFKYEQNKWINDRIFGRSGRKASVTETIHALNSIIKIQLSEFIETYRIDVLIAENSLSIPLHLPLGLVLTKLIADADVSAVRDILETPARRAAMVDHNYRVAQRHYAYSGLRRWLGTHMIDIFGVD